ncbi:MAG: hydroxyacid dehydrogenase [Dehalococcoidia bacterium]
MPRAKSYRAVFFEVEPWEREALSSSLADLELAFREEPLSSGTCGLAEGAAVVSVFIRSRIDQAVIDCLPDLRLLVSRSTGFDHIDLPACDRRGIPVCNVPFYGENTVAEHTFALILALSRNVHKAYQRTSRGDFTLEGLRGWDLKGRTIGVVGAGSIGLHVIRIAKGFGMEVLAHDARENRLMAEVLGFRYVPLDELLAQSDIVTLQVPHSVRTHHLIDREALQKMKPGALLINTARGGILDTNALVWALDQGIVGGAGLDVLEGEELISEEKELLSDQVAEDKLRVLLQNHILMHRSNVVITPHIGFFSEEALQRIIDVTVSNVRNWLRGHPENVVNDPQGGLS